MILDTSFLLDLKDGDDAAFQRATAFYERNVVQRVPTPVVAELQYGVAYAESEEEHRRVRNLLLMYPVVDLDEATARRAGDLLAAADLAADGDSGVDTVDGFVAAVAAQYDEPVVTANERGFDALGVAVETY